MRMYLKPVLSGLLLMFAMSAMAQRTNEYLQPCDKPLPTYTMVWSGNMLEDPEGFQKQMEEMMKSPRNYDVVCWSTKVEPSFNCLILASRVAQQPVYGVSSGTKSAESDRASRA